MSIRKSCCVWFHLSGGDEIACDRKATSYLSGTSAILNEEDGVHCHCECQSLLLPFLFLQFTSRLQQMVIDYLQRQNTQHKGKTYINLQLSTFYFHERQRPASFFFSLCQVIQYNSRYNCYILLHADYDEHSASFRLFISSSSHRNNIRGSKSIQPECASKPFHPITFATICSLKSAISALRAFTSSSSCSFSALTAAAAVCAAWRFFSSSFNAASSF